MKPYTYLEFDNSQLAWEGINEYIVNNESLIKEKGGAIYSTELVIYNTIVFIKNGKMDKYFNFGKVLGYQDKKWSKLLNNYVNLNYLDLIKNEIQLREKKKGPKSYNHTYHFDNSHGSGKDCLISMTFQRSKNNELPIVYFHTRASEVTKRLPFDFLLIQRIVEFIYGRKQKFNLYCYMPFMFVNAPCFLMYLAWKGKKIIKAELKETKKNIWKEYSYFQKKILEEYNKFLSKPLEHIKYKVHQRAARQVHAWAGLCDNLPDLFAKDLTLFKRIKRKEKWIEALDGSMIKQPEFPEDRVGQKYY